MSKKDKSASSPTVKKKKKASLDYRILFRSIKVFGVHYRQHWKLLFSTHVGLLISVALALFLPWPLKLVVDYIILQNPFPEQAEFLTQWFGHEAPGLLLALTVGFVALNFLYSFFSFTYKVGVIIIAARMANSIRERVFSHLLKLSLSFHESARSGDIIYRLTSDMHELPKLIVNVPLDAIYRFVMIGAHIGLMLALDWRLALIAFSIIPILSYANQRFGSGVQSATKEKRSKESDVTSIISENVAGMALIQAYGREDLQQARFAAENRESLASGITAMKLSKIFKRVSDTLIAVGTAGVVYYGGRLALDSTILPGTLVLFAAYLKRLYSPIDKFAGLVLDVAKAQVSAERILELLETEALVKDAPHAIPAPAFKGRLEFRRVSFSYQNGVAIIKDLSLIVKPGETIAVVGHSGAGKSTFVSLLLRFYDPPQGQILIDGRDNREFTLKSLRAQLTILMQGAKLFNKTVRENIGFGKIDASDKEIVQAAKLAQAHDFILGMPEDYDTMISEGGDNLSGGQRQRLNIARAIIRNTPILILDEPATALDAKTEMQIHEALAELMQDKTTFMIAHNFATIARADKILVLEKGRPAAFGTHHELMRSSHAYRELYELQAKPAFGSHPENHQADWTPVQEEVEN